VGASIDFRSGGAEFTLAAFADELICACDATLPGRVASGVEEPRERAGGHCGGR
jgi:hypothetical protein